MLRESSVRLLTLQNIQLNYVKTPGEGMAMYNSMAYWTTFLFAAAQCSVKMSKMLKKAASVPVQEGIQLSHSLSPTKTEILEKNRKQKDNYESC